MPLDQVRYGQEALKFDEFELRRYLEELFNKSLEECRFGPEIPHTTTMCFVCGHRLHRKVLVFVDSTKNVSGGYRRAFRQVSSHHAETPVEAALCRHAASIFCAAPCAQWLLVKAAHVPLLLSPARQAANPLISSAPFPGIISNGQEVWKGTLSDTRYGTLPHRRSWRPGREASVRVALVHVAARRATTRTQLRFTSRQPLPRSRRASTIPARCLSTWVLAPRRDTVAAHTHTHNRYKPTASQLDEEHLSAVPSRLAPNYFVSVTLPPSTHHPEILGKKKMKDSHSYIDICQADLDYKLYCCDLPAAPPTTCTDLAPALRAYLSVYSLLKRLLPQEHEAYVSIPHEYEKHLIPFSSSTNQKHRVLVEAFVCFLFCEWGREGVKSIKSEGYCVWERLENSRTLWTGGTWTKLRSMSGTCAEDDNRRSAAPVLTSRRGIFVPSTRPEPSTRPSAEGHSTTGSSVSCPDDGVGVEYYESELSRRRPIKAGRPLQDSFLQHSSHSSTGTDSKPHNPASHYKNTRIACQVTQISELLDCSPPTKANRVQSPGRFIPDFRKRESCRTMPLVGGFSRGSPSGSESAHFTVDSLYMYCSIYCLTTVIKSTLLGDLPFPHALSFRSCSVLTSLHPHGLSRTPTCKSRTNLSTPLQEPAAADVARRPGRNKATSDHPMTDDVDLPGRELGLPGTPKNNRPLPTNTHTLFFLLGQTIPPSFRYNQSTSRAWRKGGKRACIYAPPLATPRGKYFPSMTSGATPRK
ncbi:hypothetical protein PR048_028079 [Dryococelus australis]|uniref:Uncharacterized protein n=1 Tax=Dryococelus australis TaxID=614101 RepID=A0ABQ9GI91_9NEOP|nr:hypothetical protein PR048_028079 [Dryococelus australis]